MTDLEPSCEDTYWIVAIVVISENTRELHTWPQRAPNEYLAVPRTSRNSLYPVPRWKRYQ